MRGAACLMVMSAVMWSGCASPTAASRNINHVSSEYRAVPASVIAELPGKIARLPVAKSMRGIDFLRELDLEDYLGNFEGRGRGEGEAMRLDKTSVLLIRFRPGSLFFSRDDVMGVSPSRTPQADLMKIKLRSSEPRVEGCALYHGRDVVIEWRLSEAARQ